MTECFLIRHAKSQPDIAIEESLWPLSAKGREQAEELKDKLLDAGIQRIFSSPYPRAIDTVLPLAKTLKLEVELRDDLRERKLAGRLIEEWSAALIEIEKTWEDFDYHLAGGESSTVCQRRAMTCLTAIIKESAGLKIAVSSHGNTLALIMNAIDPTFRFKEWKEMGNPHVFKILWDGNRLTWDKKFAA